jgi:hypothetical protein
MASLESAMRRAVLKLLALSFLALMGMPEANAAKRVALVIGIDAYDNLPALQKAVNDERAVAGALSGLGFHVIRDENLTRREMNAKLAELDQKIAPGDATSWLEVNHESEPNRNNRFSFVEKSRRGKIIELLDDTRAMWIRLDLNTRQIFWSTDGNKSWNYLYEITATK